MSFVGVTASPAADWSKAERISVVMTDFRFEPMTISLKQGRPYVLHLSNTSERRHRFTAKGFLKASKISSADGLHVDAGEIILGGGQSGDLDLVAPRAGRYALHCGEKDHVAMGMTGVISVR